MANATATAQSNFSLLAPFRAVGRFMIRVGEAGARVKRIEYLNSLTDTQLAERGLKREDIVREVFHDRFMF